MSSFLISSYSLTAAPRSSVSLAQADLGTAQKELATMRKADVGLALGVGTGRVVSLRAEMDTTLSYLDTNKLLLQRFDMMQNVLTTLGETADTVMSKLIAGGSGPGSAKINAESALGALDQLSAALNSTDGPRFLFSGPATEQRSISFSSTGGGEARTYGDQSTASQATRDALTSFMTTNGIASLDEMSGDQLDDFLASDFAALFDDANWQANWSNASSTPVNNRISPTDSVRTSYDANGAAFRQIAGAYVMLADLDSAEMGDEARARLVTRASEMLGTGIKSLTDLRASIGGAEARVEASNEALTSRKSVLNMAIVNLEEVDPYEASTRVTDLMNRLEASYALTARISRLSLLNYL